MFMRLPSQNSLLLLPLAACFLSHPNLIDSLCFDRLPGVIRAAPNGEWPAVDQPGWLDVGYSSWQVKWASRAEEARGSFTAPSIPPEWPGNGSAPGSSPAVESPPSRHSPAALCLPSAADIAPLKLSVRSKRYRPHSSCFALPRMPEDLETIDWETVRFVECPLAVIDRHPSIDGCADISTPCCTRSARKCWTPCQRAVATS